MVRDKVTLKSNASQLLHFSSPHRVIEESEELLTKRIRQRFQRSKFVYCRVQAIHCDLPEPLFFKQKTDEFGGNWTHVGGIEVEIR